MQREMRSLIPLVSRERTSLATLLLQTPACAYHMSLSHGVTMRPLADIMELLNTKRVAVPSRSAYQPVCRDIFKTENDFIEPIANDSSTQSLALVYCMKKTELLSVSQPKKGWEVCPTV